MRYLLDTNVCIELLRGKNPRVARRVLSIGFEVVGISGISLAELFYGAARSQRPSEQRANVVTLCAKLQVADFGAAEASSYGILRANLEAAGTPIGPLDTLIAAHALSLDVTLVTANVREFRRVKGIKIEDWTA